MTERDELITKWLDAMLRLQTAKDAEADLRKRVVETLFPEHKDEGTETVELGNGFKISASAYRKAPEGIKKLLNKALVITPGTPSVKFVQPNRR